MRLVLIHVVWWHRRSVGGKAEHTEGVAAGMYHHCTSYEGYACLSYRGDQEEVCT